MKKLLIASMVAAAFGAANAAQTAAHITLKNIFFIIASCW